MDSLRSPVLIINSSMTSGNIDLILKKEKSNKFTRNIYKLKQFKTKPNHGNKKLTDTDNPTKTDIT